MKPSMKEAIKMHGWWRLDKAFHMYLYFGHYTNYVKTVLKIWDPLLSLVKGLESLEMKRPTHIFKSIVDSVFQRYHAKVMSLEDVTKVLTLKEDVTIGEDSTGRIIPFKYAKKILFEEPKHIAVMDCP
ncbi:MAG: hypothetical protein J7L53_11425 [Deltaproteobacteria bacterium]|nr:hypothetical protein [Deltaproteobacteria bacterium]